MAVTFAKPVPAFYATAYQFIGSRSRDTIMTRLTVRSVEPADAGRIVVLDAACHNRDETIVLAGSAQLRLGDPISGAG
jgi:hypothetical protein